MTKIIYPLHMRATRAMAWVIAFLVPVFLFLFWLIYYQFGVR